MIIDALECTPPQLVLDTQIVDKDGRMVAMEWIDTKRRTGKEVITTELRVGVYDLIRKCNCLHAHFNPECIYWHVDNPFPYDIVVKGIKNPTETQLEEMVNVQL